MAKIDARLIQRAGFLRLLFAATLAGATVSWFGAAQAQTTAPPPATQAAFGDALRHFVQENNLTAATITVRKGGIKVYELGLGTARPDQLQNVASLSKAITGACIGTLIRDGLLTIDTPLAEAAPKLLKSVPALGDERMRHLTVAQLLTHTAGFAGNNGDGEVTTGPVRSEVEKASGASHASAVRLARLALGQKLKHEPGTFHYSNDGFAVLGRIIEEKTGQTYAQACTARVLDPAGARGEIAGITALMDAYAGWRFSGNDYLKVVEKVSRGAGIIGPQMQAWKSAPQPYNTRSQGLWYGPGLLIRRQANNYNHFHWGSWKARHIGPAGPVNLSFNAFAAHIGARDVAYFVYFEPQLPQDKRLQLDKLLWETLGRVRSWTP